MTRPTACLPVRISRATRQASYNSSGGTVAEDSPAGAVHERIDHVVGEAVRVGGERLRRDDPHQLPVTGRRVLPLRPLHEPACHRRRAGLGRASFERLDVAEPERLEARQVEPADGSGYVAQGVRAFVAVLRRVRQLAGADGVEHDDAGSGHQAILGVPVSTALGLLAFLAYVVAVIAVAAAVTWVVVRLTPAQKRNGSPRT